MKKLYTALVAAFVCAALLLACDDDEPETVTPKVELKAGAVTASTLSFTITPADAQEVAYVVIKKGEAVPEAAAILETGTKGQADAPKEYTAGGLDAKTAYVIAAAAVNGNVYSPVAQIEMSTNDVPPTDKPIVTVTAGEASSTSLSFTITPADAQEVAYVVIKKGETVPEAAAILETGTKGQADAPKEYTASGLDVETAYIIAAAAVNGSIYSAVATLEMTTAAAGTHINLGAGANCYIVSHAGEYYFEPLKVSGTQIEGIVSADWIWATKMSKDDTEQALVSDVRYESGKIYFTATGNEGNAVLAGFDADGTIIWVWQIWCTDRPDTMEYENGGVFMDRYVGATSADQDDRQGTTGLCWQWGRNVPIFGGYDDEWGEKEVWNAARPWTIMNPTYGLEWKVEKRTVTVEESLASPTTFFTSAPTQNWYHIDKTNDLWLATGEKSDYDPCPAGYRMPHPSEWEELKKGMFLEDNGGTYTWNGKTAWWPKGNTRKYDTGENILGLPGTFHAWSGLAELWEPYPGLLPPEDYPFRLGSMGLSWPVSPRSPGFAAFGHMVRCIAQ